MAETKKKTTKKKKSGKYSSIPGAGRFSKEMMNEMLGPMGPKVM